MHDKRPYRALETDFRSDLRGHLTAQVPPIVVVDSQDADVLVSRESLHCADVIGCLQGCGDRRVTQAMRPDSSYAGGLTEFSHDAPDAADSCPRDSRKPAAAVMQVAPTNSAKLSKSLRYARSVCSLLPAKNATIRDAGVGS